ncbi:MAG TPA: ABC transporter ATP-binding protein [Puia sp.]|jgi:ATP-binding cassette subfamily B protein|nr:ABC transporter ATP-binding protein [Puia sp.]
MSSTNYNLNIVAEQQPKSSTWSALRKLVGLLPEQRSKLIMALVAILINSVLSLLAPMIIGITIDKYILTKNYHGVLVNCGLLLIIYLGAMVTIYLRTVLMGGFGQNLLFALRNAIFTKLQELPVAFFSQNKAGDLISRVNNDTDKINQFFSQSLMQFVSSLFLITGAGIFLLALNFRLGLATLTPALLLWIFTKFVSPWVKKKNAMSMKSTGLLSSEVQESLNNFKVIIAFNRRDYFVKKFNEVNRQNYSASVQAGIANNVFMPVSGFASSMGQFIVLGFGIYLISTGHFTAGFLISFFSYVVNFYDPLRQMAALWANFQIALAGWDRISQILSLESDLSTLPAGQTADVSAPLTVVSSTDRSAAGVNAPLLEFRNVSFHYPDGTEVLHNNSFRLEKGKTYALVGPTGGGKTTTASLIARLYDPTAGTVYLDGKDIRSYDAKERSGKIGFILQEPFLFSGSVRDNLLYGNAAYKDYSNEHLEEVIRAAGLETLLTRFDAGLDTNISSGGDGISLGQKQLIAFMRAVLRNPELLILDEATANIDTVTEKMLEDILQKLPDTTTRVIIAHRLNTIENADEIFFVNSGTITRAGSLDQAVDMLLHGKRVS